MKTAKTILWGLTALAILSAPAGCGKIDNTPDETTPETTQPETQETVKSIPFSVTVGSGTPETRATVDADNKTLRFAAGDKLYIASDSRADLKGALTLKAGDEGKTNGATFEGSLTYTGDAPADDLELKATLVGGSNAGIGITDGKVTGITYPAGAYCTDVNDAVEKYSYLTGTSTYGARSFTLSQGTAFLNFALTLNDGTATATDITATVTNGASTLSTATVTTTTEDAKVVAKFVLPVAATTVLSGAKLTVAGSRTPAVKNIDGATPITLAAKVYNVKRDELTLGDLYYSDGSASTTLVDGKTPIGVIAYLGTDNFTENGVTLRDNTTVLQSHGLVLCLKNVATNVVWGPYNLNYYEFGKDNAVSDINDMKRTENVSGYSNTKTIAEKANASTDYPALYQAWNYTTLPAPATTTGWFMPSAQQWVRMQTGLGGTNIDDFPVMNGYYAPSGATNIETALAKAGSGNYESIKTSNVNMYWTSTERRNDNYTDGRNVIIFYVNDSGFRWSGNGKHDTAAASYCIVRPVLGF